MVAGMLSCLRVQEPTPAQCGRRGQAGVGLRGREGGGWLVLGWAGGAHITHPPYPGKLKSLNMVASKSS